MARDRAGTRGREREAQREAQRAAGRFRTPPQVLATRTPDGVVRVRVEGETLLHVPAHDPPFQLERCCTQCGSADPVRWPATRVREVAGAPVRVPDGHRCFWCRCQDLTSGRPAPAPRRAAPRPVPSVSPGRDAPAAPPKPWWRRLYGIPAWAEIGPLRSTG